MVKKQDEKERILYWPRRGRFWKPRVVYAKGSIVDDQRHGMWQFWYENGQPQLKGEYLKGKKTGIWTKWYKTGEKLSEGEFLYGKMNGIWTDWYENGQKALESCWVTGKRDGRWTYWKRDGSIRKKETYHHEKEFDLDYSIHTDLEEKQIVKKIQQDRMNRAWERLVGRTIGRLVKPWHVGFWVLCFVPLIAFLEAKTQWRGVVQAALLAFVITSAVVWVLSRKHPK